MNYSLMTERETEIELGTGVGEGLSSFTAHDRLIDNGRNLPEKTYGKKVWTVFVSQFKNLYTIAFLTLAIITALCDFKNSMAAWMIFLAVAVINMVSGFLRDNEERKIAESFDRKREGEVKIIRDGKLMSSDPTLLVKGDVVILEQGDVVPCDLRILFADNLKADESIFRYSKVPVQKKSERLDEGEVYALAENMLYCGTEIVQGEAKGAVVAVGKDTFLAKTIRKKSKQLDTHDKFARNAKSEKVLALGALLCAVGVTVYGMATKKDINAALLSACCVSFCLLPAPVAMVRAWAIKYFSKAFGKKGVKFEQKDFAFDVGMTEYLVFDKGGMLTSEDMELEETVVAFSEVVHMAAVCSDCKFYGDKVKGNGIDTATARYLMKKGIDAERLVVGTEKVMFMPFDESRKLMAALVEKNDGYRLIVKGSVEVIPTLCSFMREGDGMIEMDGEAMHKIETVSSDMAERGLKVRAVAYRDIDILPEDIENEIKELTFVGMLGYREIVVDGAKEAFESLRSVFVTPVMVTGDHTVTAATLAREAGLIESEAECVSFREIGEIDDEKLFEMTNTYKVFAGASREDRERLVRVLSERGYMVAVAGEEMSASQVAMYSSAVFSESGDVSGEADDVVKVSSVVCEARKMRSNMANASLLAISVGFAEVIMMLYLMLGKSFMSFKSIELLVLNLFVAFVPCFAVALFGNCRERLKNEKNQALLSVINGVIAAVTAIYVSSFNEKSAIWAFFAFYAVLYGAGFVVESIKKEKKIRSIKSLVIFGVIFAIVCFAVMLNGAVSGRIALMTVTVASIAAALGVLLSYALKRK